MIESYFEHFEKTIQDFPYVRSYMLSKKVHNAKQGFIRGVIQFEDDTRLEFVEVKDTDVIEKIKYRYQYMKKDNTMVFRYDNAPHHSHLRTFPHHKHIDENQVKEIREPTLDEVLLEIAKRIRTYFKMGGLFCLCALVPLLFITGCIQSKPYIKPYDYQANREAVIVYEKALAYEQGGSLELAIAEFRHYLDYYDSLYHANEAQLKIAECYKTLAQWDEAISNYRIYIKKYKGSEKIPEAMFQLGECLETANQWKDAVAAYKKLIKNHFATNWSQKAQERITEILKKFPKAQWARKEKIAVRTLVRNMSRK